MMKVISRLLFLCVLHIFILLLQKTSACGADSWRDDQGGDFFELFDKTKTGAEIIPDEINLFIGEAVQVFGIQHDANISDIIFVICHDGQEIRLNTMRRNDTHVVTILEGSEKIKGKQTLTMSGITGGSKSPKELDSINVFILDPLQNVTNVSSIWHYSTKQFEVQWQSPANYCRRVSVETTWISNDFKTDGLFNCSFSNNTFCRVEQAVRSILYFHMVTKVDDYWWKTYRQNQEYFLQPQIQEFPHFVYRVEPKEKVMPERPSSLIISGKSSRCFNISWINPGYFIFHKENALYYIEFKDENTDKVKKTHSSELPFSETGKVMLQFCGLDPNTFYRVNLQVKPKKDGYWSNPTEGFASTSEDRPSNGPPMTKTSFWLGNCHEGKRDLILYWNDLEPKEANGELTHFLVELNSTIGYVRRSMNYMDAQLGCNESCQVKVYSATDIGRTEHPSRLKIPSNVFSPPFPVDFKVEKLTENRETGRMDVNMTWDYDNLAALHNVSLIVYFCQGQTFSNKYCLDDFTHKIVPFQKQFLELRHIPLRTDRFGYALEKNQNELSGITWSDCIYSRDKEPSEVTGVKAFPHDAVGSILVVWNAQRCSQDTKALVLRYRVQYCTMSKQCQVKIAEGGYSSSLVLKNLDVRETYTIQVSAVALNGTGPFSPPVISTPLNSSKDDSPAVNIGIISAIIAIIILAFFVFCCCWKLRQRKKKMRETLPYLPFEQKKKGADPYHSDSGINTQTALNSTQTSTDDSVNPYEIIRNEEAVHESIPPEPLANSPDENSTPSQDMPSRLQDSFPEPRRSEMAQAQAVELETILPTIQVIEENAAQQEGTENKTVGAECLTNISNKESCVDHQKPIVSNNVQDVDDYYPPTNQPPFQDVADVNAERCDDLFYETELVTTRNDNFTNSPNIQIPDLGNMCEVLNQNNTDLLPCIKNGHDMENKGNDQSCSSDGNSDKAMTGNSRSGESSSSSLTPNSYVHITTVEKSNTSRSPVETSDSVDNFVVDFRNSPQTKLFIPTSDGDGREQTATVYARFSLDGSSPIDKCHSSTAGIEYLTQMKDIQDSSQNIKDLDRLKDSHVKGISMKVEKDNPAMQSLSNGTRAYVAPNDLIQNMLYERKISEDEGISSPGIFMESSNATEPNYIDLVDVSHLQSDSTDEISDEEYAENGADEFSGNGNNDYTD